MPPKQKIVVFLYIVFVFFNSHNSFSKTVSKQINFEVFYLKNTSELTINTIHFNKFKKLPKSKNLGTSNGLYWFKIIVEKNKQNHSLISYIPTHNIDRIDVFEYSNNSLNFVTKIGNSISIDELDFYFKYPAFEVFSNTEKNTTYFLKVNFIKEANFPIKIISKKDFLPYILKKKTINSLYYGTAFIVILLILFFYIKFKVKRYLYYFIYLIALTFNFLLFDGSLIDSFRGIYFYYYLEFILHLTEITCLLLFSISFLELNKNYSKYAKLSFLFPVGVIISYFLFLSTKNYSFAAYGDVLGILIFPFIWFIGFSYLKKIPHSKFYVICYFLILPLGIYCFFGYNFGNWYIDGDLLIVKIIGWLNMLIFTFAIIYKLIFNNEQIEKTLSDLKKYLNTQTNKPQNPDPFFIFLKENTITNEKLTLREIDILKYLNDGLNNKQIAEKLFISTNTVKYHVRNIYNKINVSNRLELKNVLSNITY